MKRVLLIVIVTLLVLGGVLYVLLEPIRRTAVVVLSEDYTPSGDGALAATFSDADGAQRGSIDLVPRVADLEQPVEIAFPPGQPGIAVILERKGRALWVDRGDGSRGTLLSIDVLTRSEQGLLGIAFHPGFASNGRFFLNYVARRDGEGTTVIEEWRVEPGASLKTAQAEAHAVLLTVPQPYANHNGGQVLFGPDGKLYIPLGDGGLKDDIHGHGQNRETLLGSILRLDVDAPAPHVPADNPFVGQDGVRPEIWAYGLRNPWRVSFDPQGRLIVADVGQNAWEEVGFARAGASLGWNPWEGRHCFPPGEDCAPGEHIQPFWEYPRNVGTSITGGQVYRGTALPALANRYIVGDFVSGRLFAVPVPSEGDGPVSAADVIGLGKWDIHPSSFAITPEGELWMADFGQGRVLEFASNN